MRHSISILWGATLLFACGSEDRGPTLYTASGMEAATLDGESEASSQDGDGDGDPGDGDPGDGDPGDGDGDSGGIKLDTLPTDTGVDDGVLEDGCSKVDFLFVIDNSISMGDEQQNLETSFPEFIATIQSQVVEDYHVMVVDTDNHDKYDEDLAECHDSKCDGEPAGEECGVI
ncbi:MAG TPA: hypothetical protein VM869_24875, partial [Enhygromyxa sp.]|nr:hypothetical protein [Enhygromyxa sp.]